MNDDRFFAYFGNENDNVRKNSSYSDHLFLNLKQKLDNHLHSLFFLKQTHSADVFVLDDTYSPKTPLDLFHHSGDAIVTNKKNCAIGVVTADCLPVVLYDPKQNAIGVIHAGWRGLSKHIISETIQKMRDHFQTDASSLQAYLGPSAGVCCYEVQKDFLSHFPALFLKNIKNIKNNIIEKRDEKLFLNQRETAVLELLDNQLLSSKIDSSRNECTLCNPGFCSARIQKENAGRQPTIAFLHSLHFLQ